MKPTKYGGVFEDSHTLDKIKKEEEETLKPDFWNDKEKAESTFSRLNALKESYYPWKDLISEIDDVSELIEMYSSEEDPDLEAELKAQIDSVIERFKPLKTKALLDGEFDKNNLFLTIHAGAGGTEASDWASMLMRMYLRWCERKGFKTEILELEENEGNP